MKNLNDDQKPDCPKVIGRAEFVEKDRKIIGNDANFTTRSAWLKELIRVKTKFGKFELKILLIKRSVRVLLHMN